MNFLGELFCYNTCLTQSHLTPLIAVLVGLSVLFFMIQLFNQSPNMRLAIFTAGQISIATAIVVSFVAMKCNSMITVQLYSFYVAATMAVLFFVPKYYDRILIRRLNAQPLSVIDWVQGFVNRMTRASVYFYDSAVPRAFASGRSIFVSLGMLEILDDNELKAVLAHEAWHIRHNNKTPFLRQLAMMTFSTPKVTELESLADRFAEKIAGKEALESARKKIMCYDSNKNGIN